MKTYLHRIILLHVFILSFTGSPAQTTILRYCFFDMPEFAPGASQMIALSKLVLKGNNYSVLIKVRLPNDPVFYTLPGHFPTGESFGYRLKVGHSKTQTDTLFFYHREGEKSIRLEEVVIYFFHPRERLIPQRSDRDFTKAVLKSYYDPRTRRGAVMPAGEQEIFPSLSPTHSLSYLSNFKTDFN